MYQKVSIRVMDMNGKVIEQMNNLNTEEEIRIGDKYVSGIYAVEILQGINRKMIKLIKTQ